MVVNTFRQVLHSLGLGSPPKSSRMGQWFKWLVPGLAVKRWLLLSVGGVLLVSLGIAIWVGLTPVRRLIDFTVGLFSWVTAILPNYISGPLLLLLGLLLIFWGQSETLGLITAVLKPERDEELVDMLLAHRRRHRGPKIVAIGGGTGLATLLRGLKSCSANITAIVTVADDGGSSGRLRREIGVLPPGDIRNCLAALAGEEKLLTELFQYRFQAGDGLRGHSFGNLFLTVLSEITGDLEQAIAACSRVLAVQGQVLPATLSDVSLWAQLADGRIIEGESQIAGAGGKIVRLGCIPPDPPALPQALAALQSAEYIIIGPGSLYTSVIPNLLVPDIAAAISERQVPCIYICNIMTEPGETDGYSVADHIRAIDELCGYALFDAVLVQRQLPSTPTLERYAEAKSEPVQFDREAVLHLNRRVIMADVMDEQEKGLIRHDPHRLAGVLLRWYGRARGLLA